LVLVLLDNCFHSLLPVGQMLNCIFRNPTWLLIAAR
jgi:hypothetical protein